MDIPNLIDKNKTKKRQIKMINVIFVTLLVVGSLLVGFYVGKGRDNEKGDVLGEKKRVVLQKPTTSLPAVSMGSVLGTMSNQTGQTFQDAIKRLTSIITDTASKSAQNVSNTLFDNTVGTVLKQINNLPAKQQEDIRRNICK
jgi:hypothetical protein